MGSTAPNVQSLTARAPAVAGGSDATSNVGEAPFPGTVTEVSYIPANLNVNQDDVLALQSLHVGTGIADPGGLVEVEISRTSTQ
jgi:hypothetical protein